MESGIEDSLDRLTWREFVVFRDDGQSVFQSGTGGPIFTVTLTSRPDWPLVSADDVFLLFFFSFGGIKFLFRGKFQSFVAVAVHWRW